MKINTTRANIPLTQREYDRLVEDKYTINLSNRLTTKQIKKRIAERKQFNTARSVLKWAVIPFIAFMLLIVASLFPNHSEANYIPDEYRYYWVDNFQDYARAVRKETCYRVWTKILWKVTEEQIKHCTTVNTLITAIESNYMKSNRCIKNNNCKWLKGWQNWRYWFMKFNSLYEQNLYFAEKWFTYHYKKSLHTLVYWYRQKDWSYKFGWTYTQQNTYYTFLRNKYYKVYNNL